MYIMGLLPLVILAVISIAVILFFVNNGISGAHSDSCKILEYYNEYRSRSYHPFIDENGVPQLYKYDSAWGYNNRVLSYEQGWGRLLDTSGHWAEVSFVGGQCDEWKKLLQ